jgi:hypothetical protein
MRKELYRQNYASQTRQHCHTTHNAKWPKHTPEIGKDATGMMGNERESGTPRSKFWKKRSALRFHDQTGSNQRVIWGIIAQNVSMLLVLFIHHQWALCVYSSVVISTHLFGTCESPLFHILCDGMRLRRSEFWTSYSPPWELEISHRLRRFHLKSTTDNKPSKSKGY